MANIQTRKKQNLAVPGLFSFWVTPTNQEMIASTQATMVMMPAIVPGAGLEVLDAGPVDLGEQDGDAGELRACYLRYLG